MDPMTVLLSALALAGPALKPVADQAVKDAYAGLKTLLASRFGSKNPRLEHTLQVHAEDPETFKPSAEKMLREVGADKDQEVIDAATKLLKQAEHAQPGVTGGMVDQINAQGGRVVVIHGEFSGTLNMGDQIDQ